MVCSIEVNVFRSGINMTAIKFINWKIMIVLVQNHTDSMIRFELLFDTTNRFDFEFFLKLHIPCIAWYSIELHAQALVFVLMSSCNSNTFKWKWLTLILHLRWLILCHRERSYRFPKQGDVHGFSLTFPATIMHKPTTIHMSESLYFTFRWHSNDLWT